MKLSARSAAWLLPLLLTGCPHKTKVAQNQPMAPPLEDSQTAKPEPSPTHLAPPEVTIAEQPHQQQQIAPPPEPVKKDAPKQPDTPKATKTETPPTPPPVKVAKADPEPAPQPATLT